MTEKRQGHCENKGAFEDDVPFAEDAIVLLDDAGKIVHWNSSAEVVFGYSADEALGKQLHGVLSTEPFFKAYMKDVLRADEKKSNPAAAKMIDFAALKKNGKAIPVELSLSSLKTGNEWRTIGVIRDVSQRKQSEAEKHRLERQLMQAQKMEAVGALAGGIAHDFNNLLTTIIGHAHLVLAEISENDAWSPAFEEIRAAGEKASALTRQLLAFSRKQYTKPVILNLNTVLGELEKMLGRLIREDIELITSFDPDLSPVFADPLQMEQVVINLAVNARDAMPSGGRLTLDTANVELDEAFFLERNVKPCPGHYIRLTVSDTGVGMEKETQCRVFEPFFTTKAKDEGTGLGLSMAYGIVKQNRGYIWVHSEPENGAVFRIYLPAAEGESPAMQKKSARLEEFSGSGTIMVVEDDASLRKLAETILRRGGYSVISVADGKEALRMVETHDGAIHLILTDLTMPGMSGEELAERVKRLGTGMRMLFMSGYSRNASAEYATLDSGIPFIEKPFTPEILLKSVRMTLEA